MYDGAADTLAGVELRTKPFETVMDVKRMVARRYGVTVQDIEGPSRAPMFSHPRQVAMALAYRRLKSKGASYPLIGREFGGRHWTTVIFACRKFGRNADPQLSEIARRAVDTRQKRIAAAERKAEKREAVPTPPEPEYRTREQIRRRHWMREAGFFGGVS
jgi:hypothetical protein